MINFIVHILLAISFIISFVLTGYFFIYVLEKLIGCIGVVILGVVIVLVLLF